MCLSRFIAEPPAIVSGPAAYLLSRWLRSPSATASLRAARWLHGADVAEALNAIHAAGRAWESTINVQGRQTDVVKVRSPHACGTMTTEKASETLQISRRHIQRLAQEGVITGRRVGRRWQLDVGSVTIYQQQKRAS